MTVIFIIAAVWLAAILLQSREPSVRTPSTSNTKQVIDLKRLSKLRGF